jgi:PAS domain S-box-containing protein
VSALRFLRRQPVRVAGVYLVVSFLWILFSDAAVLAFARAPGEIQTWSTVKGWVYVVIVAAMLYSLLEADRRAVERFKGRIERLNRLYSVLAEVSRVIVSLPEEPDVLAEVCRIATDVGGLRMAWVGMVDETTKILRPVATAGLAGGYLEGLDLSTRMPAEDRGPTVAALAGGRPVVMDDLSSEPPGAEWLRRAQERGFRAAAGFPLREGGRVVGAMSVYAAAPGHFGPDEVAVLERLADYVSFSLDYAADRRSRAEDERHLREWADIFRNTRVGILLTRAPGDVIGACNPAYAAMHGYSVDELIGQPIALTLPQERVDEVASQAARAADLGHYVFESVHLRRDGTTFPVSNDVTVVYDESGAALYGIATVTDITERRAEQDELERHREHLEDLVEARTIELRELNERLQQATAAKSQFLANMSHELRTPLNSIIGFSGILLQGMAGELQEEQRKQVEMVNRSGRYLLSLINNILDLSRIEAGRMLADVQPFDARDVMAAVEHTIRPLAEQKGLSLAVDVPDAPIAMRSDREKLQQVLINLAGNAVKFTEAGGVVLSACVSDDELVVRITDTGIGMTEEQIGLAFDEFYQVPDTRGAKAEGTGLGLPISRRLAEILGGAIEVESRVGEGSEFKVHVALALATPSSGPAGVRQAGGGHTIGS